MKQNLKHYLDSVFASAPSTQKNEELREEVLADLYDKYDRYLSEGFSTEEAYRKTIAGVGDLSALFERLEPSQHHDTPADARTPLHTPKQKERFAAIRALLLSLAVALYILSIIPAAVLPNLWGPVLMFCTVALATGMILCLPLCTPHTVPADTDEATRQRVTRALRTATWMRALAVMAYIVCVCPVILFSNRPLIGLIGMFLLIAGATMLFIFRSLRFGASLSLLKTEGNAKNPPKKDKETIADSPSDKWFALIALIFWLLVIVAYFVVSFLTHRWELTWLIFIYALLFYGIVGGVYKLVRRRGTAGPIVKIVICSILLAALLPLPFLTVGNIDFDTSVLSFRFNTYDDSDYKRGETAIPAEALASLHELSVHWEDGTVAIERWDKDYVAIRETYVGSNEAITDEEDALRYRLADSELTVREYAPYAFFFGIRGFSKNLTIFLPADSNLQVLHVEGVSADTEISHLTCRMLHAETVSGRLALTDCETSTITLSSVSGQVVLNDCKVPELDVESVSGEIVLQHCHVAGLLELESVSGSFTIDLTTTPVHVEMNTVSGTATLCLPEDTAGFRVSMSSISGDADIDFADGSWAGKSFRYGNGSADIQFESISGDLSVKKRK